MPIPQNNIGGSSTASAANPSPPASVVPSPALAGAPLELAWRPPRARLWGHPSFTPEWGRVTRGFDPIPSQREWQAEQILRNFEQWPPREGEVYVIQIDQDSPPPPPARPKANILAGKFQEWAQANRTAVTELQRFVTQYTGQTTVFRAQRVDGKLRLVELNPNGPLRSASHVSDVGGQGSCNGMICGIAWLRSGVYPYKTRFNGVFTTGIFNPVQDSLTDVARDINNDGAIDRDESIRSSSAYGFGIQIHAGFLNSPRSTGCQTFPPADFKTLQDTIQATNVDAFSYVLVRRPNEKTGPYVW